MAERLTGFRSFLSSHVLVFILAVVALAILTALALTSRMMFIINGVAVPDFALIMAAAVQAGAATALAVYTLRLVAATGALTQATEALVRSGNKQASIAAAEMRQRAWYEISQGFDASPEHERKFLEGGLYIWGDDRAYLWREIAEVVQGHRTQGENFATDYQKLEAIARQRVIDYSKVIEDMRRRPASSFTEIEGWAQPDIYPFQVFKHYGNPRTR